MTTRDSHAPKTAPSAPGADGTRPRLTSVPAAKADPKATPGSTAKASARATVVLIVQRSTIELFGAYGVAIAPAARSLAGAVDRPPNQLVGVVAVAAGTRRGRLTLSTSDATLSRTNPSAADSSSLPDWLRELTNQLAGRIANRFARYRLPITAGLPTAFKEKQAKQDVDHDDNVAKSLSLAFHVLRDTVHVTLTGGFEDAELSYQPEAVAVTGEGNVILF